MTEFDQELKIFTKIIPEYKPINGYHLVLDLADYKSGKETIQKYPIGCKDYRHYINVDCHEKNIEIVIITSNKGHQITYRSKFMYAIYCYNRKEFIEIEDLTPLKKNLSRSMKQELELLVFNLNNPQPDKPSC